MGTSSLSSPIASALFGKTRREVLALLYGHPDQAYHLREVARLTGAGQGAVQRELARLAKAGLLNRRRRANLVLYQAAREAPVFEELRALVMKTVGLGDVLRQGLEPLADRITVAFVYGSVARSEERVGSDVDLMVIGEVGFAEVVAALEQAERTLGREINPTVYPLAEVRRRLTEEDHFLTAVMGGPKLFILGGEDEIGGLEQARLAPGAPDEPAGDR